MGKGIISKRGLQAAFFVLSLGLAATGSETVCEPGIHINCLHTRLREQKAQKKAKPKP